MKRWLPALAGIVLLALFAILAWSLYVQRRPPAPVAPAAARPPPALARLERGVNISEWLQHGPAKEPRRYQPDAEDWRRIRALGLTHVRLPVDPKALIGDRGLPDEKALQTLRTAIEGAQREDLLVVLVVQLPDAAKAGVVAREPDRTALAGQWRWLAGALRDIPPTHLAFEPLNEPGTGNAAASRALLAALATELRAVAPRHTLVISGHKYSGVEELATLKPLDDPNVVYGFHFYEPYNFTHQGATWGDPKWRALRDFPYPSSPDSVAPRLPRVPVETRPLLEWHGKERWNRERIGQRLDLAAQWAQQHKVPVWCSEFGVLKLRAGTADRAAWLNDVRVALDERGIGWAHWDYAGAFGLVTGARGQRVNDEVAVKALGLKAE